MILERLEGVAPSHVVKQSDFNDIHYLEEFLFCLFNALDIGQKSVGFHHSGRSLLSAPPSMMIAARWGVQVTYRGCLIMDIY